MSPRKTAEPEAPAEPEVPEPEVAEPEASVPNSEGGAPAAGEPEVPVAEEPPVPAEPDVPRETPDLSTQIEDALRKIRDEEAHQAEHDRVANLVTEPEEEKPKGFLERLKWGG